ncbi:PDZ domain-containing protein [Ruminiclostridium sufflavum]|nr:PDZ domain-containing protein [Ruminiclostridium sufflavum]
MKGLKKVGSLLTAAMLVLSLSVTALAATEETKITVDDSKDGYVTVSNVTSVKELQYRTVYFVSSPTTISFYGSDLMREIIYYHPNAVVTDNSVELGDLYEELTLDLKLDAEGLYYLSGNSSTLKGTGVYTVIASPEAAMGASFVVVVRDEPATAETVTATPTASKVLVNGSSVSFEAYTINGNNYFKLRDLAKVLSGTGKQFNVSWDGTSKVINLVSGSPYTVTGGEMATGDGKAKQAIINSSSIYKDGGKVSLTAYTINGNNYFKLRDIGQAFDFGVTWDGTANTIKIDTSTGYMLESSSESTTATGATLGIGGSTVSALAMMMQGWPAGVHVEAFVPNGPAQTAGMQLYDVIYKVDDTEVASTDELSTLLKTHNAGDVVKVYVYRPADYEGDGADAVEEYLTFDVTLAK